MTFWNVFWIVLGAFGLVVVSACIFFVFAACKISSNAERVSEFSYDIEKEE